MKATRKPNGKEFTTVYEITNTDKVLRALSDDGKYDEYRELWKKSTELNYIPEYPLQIDFELNYSCNFSCPMCTWSIESNKDKGKKTWFDYNVFKEVIDDGVKKGLRAIRLNNVNEPLIRKDIGKFIRYAKDAGVIDVYLSTNGSLLDREISRELIESGLSRIQISLDAFTQKTYDKIRVGGDFQGIVKNIKNLKLIRSELCSLIPLIRVNFVVVDHNIHELDKFVAYWRERADSIGIQNFHDINRSNIDSEVAHLPTFNCAQPFSNIAIRYNGNVLPCCSFYGNEIPIAQLKTGKNVVFSDVGNMAIDKNKQASLAIKTIEEAWNSEEMKFFRKIHKSGEYWKHPVCKMCVMAMGHVGVG